MEPEAQRKHLGAVVRVLKKHPGVVVNYAKVGPKLKPDKLDKLLERAGVSVPDDLKPWMCAVNGFELEWYRRDAAATDDEWQAFRDLLQDHRCKAGAPVGHIAIPTWSTMLTDRVMDRANFAPHHKAFDEFYVKRGSGDDDLFRLIDLDTDPALDAPLVRFGDDYGADYAGSLPFAIPAYLELAASTLGTGRTAVMARGSGSGYPTVSDLGALGGWSAKDAVARVVDGDAALQARWDDGIAALHAAHPAG